MVSGSGPQQETSMQSSEGSSDSASTVTLRTSAAGPPSVQAAVVQQVAAPQQVQQVQSVQHVYPSPVQYVEGGDAVYTNGTIRAAYSYPETQLYAQNPGASYFESPGNAVQVTTVVSSPTVVPSHSMVGTVGIAMEVVEFSELEVCYSGINQSRKIGDLQNDCIIEMAIENLQKSEGITAHKSTLLNSHLQWLLDNYETAEGVSLPRSSLYNHYLRHCQEQKLDPVNAASFGKLIRSVFMGLRTRRLGTRGNSKYHYYGIRLKPDSPLNRLQEDMQYMAMRQQPVHQKQRFKPMQKLDGVGDNMPGNGQHAATTTPEQSVAAQSQHHQQFLDMSRALPEFIDAEVGSCPLPEDITLNEVKTLQTLYREHCEAMLDVVINLQFHYIEKLWQTFWHSTPLPSDGASVTSVSEEESEAVFPKEKLINLCKFEPIIKWMRNCDHVLYQALVEILIPDVLRPVPSALTQAIRNFAKSLEAWLMSAMNGFPQQMVRTKVGVVSAFAQTLRRYTSLNHLAQAARAVLQNTSQINQMLSDLNRVDFANVQ
ncbi:hypothetical protein scyTo_0011152, partial [Scyliorhinus torazame]|nr:hypothetical protein [Scyliorhinus torazame]